MPVFPPAKLIAATLAAGAAVILGACSSTTYGTGTTPAAQTVEDISGILTLGGKKSGQEPIDYKPRPPLVEPPVADALPPPEDKNAETAAANWPNDPDVAAKRTEQMVADLKDSGKTLKFSVPKGEDRAKPSRDWDDRPSHERLLSDKVKNSNDIEAQKKIFADAKLAKVGSFDEQGRPIRRYLTEPPADYREPDPESPVAITEKPKPKKKWSWGSLWPF